MVLGRAFALARALRGTETLVQVVTGGTASGREVVVSDAGFTLSLNGGSPRSLDNIDDVVHALAGS